MDIDDCATDLHRCSQICTNLPGSFRCSCIEGYELEGKTNCKVNGPTPILYYSTKNEIRAVDIRNRHFFTVVQAAPGEQITAMERVGNALYYSAIHYNNDHNAANSLTSILYQVR